MLFVVVVFFFPFFLTTLPRCFPRGSALEDALGSEAVELSFQCHP